VAAAEKFIIDLDNAMAPASRALSVVIREPTCCSRRRRNNFASDDTGKGHGLCGALQQLRGDQFGDCSGFLGQDGLYSDKIVL
jgi:hypothetical protein